MCKVHNMLRDPKERALQPADVNPFAVKTKTKQSDDTIKVKLRDLKGFFLALPDPLRQC